MTVDTLLTCYICGETDDWTTVDLIGCFEDRHAAGERFEEKHGRKPDSYLFVCPECKEENPHHAENCYEKYGRVQ